MKPPIEDLIRLALTDLAEETPAVPDQTPRALRHARRRRTTTLLVSTAGLITAAMIGTPLAFAAVQSGGPAGPVPSPTVPANPSRPGPSPTNPNKPIPSPTNPNRPQPTVTVNPNTPQPTVTVNPNTPQPSVTVTVHPAIPSPTKPTRR